MKKTNAVLLLLFLAPWVGILAQDKPAPAAPIAQITLGKATFALNGPWRFRTGDNLAWAAANFDDSAWGTMDLAPPPGSYDPITGNSGFVPGWTTRDFEDTPGMRGTGCVSTFKIMCSQERMARWR
jgi:hypothetical protein